MVVAIGLNAEKSRWCVHWEALYSEAFIHFEYGDKMFS